MANVWQQPLPESYARLSDAELRLRIASAKQRLGGNLVILGHHYQQDAVTDFADFAGDSFELSRRAAEQKGIRYVIFCGVHFMAESADILTDEDVQVILPDLGAGCSMADMASLDQTLECWAQLKEHCPGQKIVPITYVNSTAAIKAFVGEHGGAVCTSSNCRAVLEWALAGGAEEGSGLRVGSPPRSFAAGALQGSGAAESLRRSTGVPPVPGNSPGHAGSRQSPKVLFFPDQHLGRNTAYAMGYGLDRMVLWDPAQELGGNDPARLRDADFVLWKGHCSVHQLFRPEHVDQVRARHPGIKVIVHPECRWEVVQKADLSGSTAHIIKVISSAPAGSQWAIGTEVHLVNRLARQHPEQRIRILSDCQCLCTTMYRIDLPHLCWAIESLVQGKVVNRISVDAQTRKWATVALQRMLTITGATRPSP